MKSVLDILKLSTEFLQKKGVVNPRRQAEEIVSNTLKMPRVDMYMAFEKPLSELELVRCRENLARRSKGEPAAYIHGSVEFMSMEFKVTSNVLIPRPETEILVDKIVRALKEQDLHEKVLWDICCGSGCIGLSLKKHLPNLNISLSDASEEALNVARENGKALDVKYCLGDLLAPFVGQKADYVVCNPPYISQAEYDTLDCEVRDYEPKMALLGGASGLEFYERLAEALPDHLNPGAHVWFEIGYNQGPALLKLFSQSPWKRAFVEQDWAGHDRFFFLERE